MKNWGYMNFAEIGNRTEPGRVPEWAYREHLENIVPGTELRKYSGLSGLRSFLRRRGL